MARSPHPAPVWRQTFPAQYVGVMRLSSVRSIEGQRASQWRNKSRLSTVRFRSRRGSVTPSATRFSSFLPMAILSSVSLAKSRKGSSALSMCQTAANAWSIAASVLGSYMSARRFREVIGDNPEEAKVKLCLRRERPNPNVESWDASYAFRRCRREYRHQADHIFG